MTITAAGIGKPTILVVDDTPSNLELMAKLLEDYNVKVAASGETALSITRSGSPPDLILLDIMMPVMDGYEVCRKLKEDSATRDIPVIFLTALTDIENEQKGFELGAADYITKPFSPPVVMARVKTHLELRAAAIFLKEKNALLDKIVAKQTAELRRSNEQLRRLTISIDKISEHERKELSREIHDELGQLLTALKIDIGWLKKQFEQKDVIIGAKIADMSAKLDMLIQSSRRIMTGLRPLMLDEIGIVAAIEAHLAGLNGSEFTSSFAAPNRDSVEDKELELSIFRIFQECMTNVLRHSGATRADVLLDITDQKVTLMVADNGRGISGWESGSINSLGILGMRERALRWGGEVEIQGSPGAGTIIRITIPLGGEEP